LAGSVINPLLRRAATIFFMSFQVQS